ncbi:MAG: hypothetical protein QME51_05670 [Planctomycetota bacterium]|nr:hypothetical protein [Planctomycetota bacterium]
MFCILYAVSGTLSIVSGTLPTGWNGLFYWVVGHSFLKLYMK